MQSAGVQDGLPSLNFHFHLFLTVSSFGKRTGRPLKISAVGPVEKNTMTVWDRPLRPLLPCRLWSRRICFHRQLKDSLKACLQGPHWMDELPLVLLGIQTAWREDPGCSASDLVYGTSLRIPGEFLPHEPRDLRVSSEFLHQLQDNMRTSSHPHMSSMVDFLPTSPTTWLPQAGCMFATMPIVVRCSAPMMGRSRSSRLTRNTTCLT